MLDSFSTYPTVTQKDVARACGVHPSTVCLALGNSPSIPLPTRQKIQNLAGKLGYQPNAAARNLASIRTSRNRIKAQLPIAWINQEPERNFWRTNTAATAQHKQAIRHTEQLGYHLDEFWLGEPGMSTTRLIDIMFSRGIEGILLPVHRQFDASFAERLRGKFETVVINDHGSTSICDTVSADHFHNTSVVLQSAHQHSPHANVGLVLEDAFDAMTAGITHAAYLHHRALHPEKVAIPVCRTSCLKSDGENQSALKDWWAQYQPAIIACCELETAYRLREIIATQAMAIQIVMIEQPATIAALAVDMLVEKLRQPQLNREARHCLVKCRIPVVA